MNYKIAIATSDKENIDLHFRKVKALAIFEVNEDDGTFKLLENRQIDFSSIQKVEKSESGCCCDSSFVTALVQIVKDCTYFLVAKIGNRPYRLLQENNINCIEAPYAISEAINKVNAYYVLHKKREVHVF
ncbi:MAG: hypothetical protein K6A89_07210 [Treponema sp.]|nr:hypothetical protein [Treponema sp.]